MLSTLWSFNITRENCPSIDDNHGDLPINILSMAMLNNQLYPLDPSSPLVQGEIMALTKSARAGRIDPSRLSTKPPVLLQVSAWGRKKKRKMQKTKAHLAA